MWSLLLVVPLGLVFAMAAPWRVTVDAGFRLPEGLVAMQIGLFRLPVMRVALDISKAQVYVQGKLLKIGGKSGAGATPRFRPDIPRLLGALHLSGRVGLLVGTGSPFATAMLVGAMSAIPCGKVRLRLFVGDQPLCKGSLSLSLSFRPLEVLSALFGRR